MKPVQSERRPDGKVSARVLERGDRVILRRCGELLGSEFGAEAVERFDGGDQIFWDFVAAGMPLTLHWQREQGIALVGSDASPSTEAFIVRVAEQLVRRLSFG